MWTVLNKLAKKLAVVAAIVVILLALGIGGFRILATQLPVYQVQLQTWVRAELGLSLDFERVDARWGLRGPELSFYGVSVANIDAPEAFLRANLASVVFDPVSLLLDSRPAISAVALEAARLTVVRTEAGRFQVQGAPAIREFGQGLFDAIPAEMELIVRDSRLVYLDAERQESWLFIDIAASAIRETGHLGLELRAVPPAALGERIELSLEGDIGAGDSPNKWSVFGELRDADVAALIRLSRSTDTVALDGSGDISLWLDVVAGDLARGLARVAMIDVVLNEASDSP